LSVGEARQCPRRVGADAGQAQQCVDVGGYHVAVVAGDCGGTGV